MCLSLSQCSLNVSELSYSLGRYAVFCMDMHFCSLYANLCRGLAIDLESMTFWSHGIKQKIQICHKKWISAKINY